MIPLWESRGLMGSLLDLLYEVLVRFVLTAVETGMVPDVILRRGVKLLCWLRLRELQQPSVELQQRRFMDFVGDLRRRPVAEQTHAPNQQHYEIPTEFYLFCLGRHMNYSAGLYREFDPRTGLDNAEAAMLALSCARARLEDGQNILDLGCGWGSLALFAAATYPGSRITAVSSSKTHKDYIETRAKERALKNLTVVVADLSTFVPSSPGTFDRIISVEVLCHLKNCEAPEGLLFVQTIVHRAWPYHLEPRGEDDWLARHFATGATMPSDALVLHFQDSALVEDQWALSGLHCALTAEDWLRNFDRNRPTIKMLFDRVYGPERCGRWMVYWRLFFLACAETFAYNGGEEWYVSQFLFRRSKGAVGPPPEPPSLAPL